MDAFETEEQQADAIRKWFKENGKSLVTTILFALTIVMGFKYWRHHQEVVKVEASEHYMALMMSQVQQDTQSAMVKANVLTDDYAHTPYAAMANLYLSKEYVEQGELDQALERLDWVINNASVDEFTFVARARAARIHLSQGRHDDALAVINVEGGEGFLPVIEELRGDIYMAKGDKASARVAYGLALDLIKKKGLEHPLLKLKLQEIGEDVSESNEANT